MTWFALLYVYISLAYAWICQHLFSRCIIRINLPLVFVCSQLFRRFRWCYIRRKVKTVINIMNVYFSNFLKTTIVVFRYSDPSTDIDQSQRLLCTCYFIIKKYIMVFHVWITWSCETVEKRKKTQAARRVFLAFRKSSNIPSVWITLSKHGKPLGNSFIK